MSNSNFPLQYFVGLLVAIVVLLFVVSWMFLEMNNYGDEPFECGFESGGKKRYPMSVEYFLVGVMFVVFDIEMIVCLPLVGLTGVKSWVISWVVIIEVLGVGYLLEVVLSTLEWKKVS
nr:NADH dehydrogenase subunit 3 [Pectinopygus varius]